VRLFYFTGGETVKTTFYRVDIEFYEYGKALACITSRELKAKPRSSYLDRPEMAAFKIWLINKRVAEELAEAVKSGDADFDDVLFFHSQIENSDGGRAAA
jgi:hypothetical protein